MKIKIFLLIILTICFTLSATKTYATEINIGVYPPIIQIDATAPTNINSPITIHNLSDQPVEINMLFKPFTASDQENGQIQYLTNNQYFLQDPFIFDKINILDGETAIKTITLSPQQTKDLILNIDIPKTEAAGDYYFSIVFDANPITDENTNSTQSLGGIASNVLLSIGPKGPTEGSIQEFSTPFFVEGGPVPFTIRVKNSSNHFITPQGMIQIKNIFKQTVGKVDLLPVNILSNTIRAIPDSLQSPEATAPANFKYKTTKYPVSFWRENFLLGPYTATLTIALSEEGPIFKREISFFAFPLQIFIGLILIGIIVVFIVIRVKKQAF